MGVDSVPRPGSALGLLQGLNLGQKKLNIILLRFKVTNQDVKHSPYVYNFASHFILAEETGQVNLSKVETSLDLTVCKYLKV